MSFANRIRAGAVMALAAVASMAIGMGAARAATYPSGGSTFSGGPEGWKVAGTPSCNIGALGTIGVCKASGGYDEGNGNPPGSLRAETEIVVNLGGLFKAEVGFESPSFKVGEGGSATLRLERELTSANLLNLTPTATYKVTLADKTAGTSAEVLADTVTGSETSFSGKTGAATLVAGHTYSLAIATETSSSAASIGLLGSTALRFDNVALVVGSSGEEGGGGAGPTNSSLTELIKNSLIGPALLKGKRLFVKAKCPAKGGRACKVKVQGLLRKGKPATAVRVAKIGKGKAKRLVLRVKPRAKSALAGKRKLLFKETVKAGTAKATVYKRLKLIRHR
ncbi:MAG TPA: hypothetical protein VMT37_12100 [Solirubrobacterales bacterium]|nr:hypothetical protein [Solirubrobacterales bacterium]